MFSMQRQIAEIALNSPEEIGGYITNAQADYQIFVVKNAAIDPHTSYIPSAPIPADSVFWHSHQRGGFSDIDIIGIWSTNYPWLVFDKSSLSFHHFDQRERRPYLGREWVRGLSDCYCLVRDWYQFELHIKLPAPTIYLGIEEQQKNQNLIQALNQHFNPVDIGKPQDLIIWQGDRNIKHLGILLNVDNQYMILHHPISQPSQLLTNLQEITGCKFYRCRHQLPSYWQEPWGTSLDVSLKSRQIDLMRLSPTASIKSTASI